LLNERNRCLRERKIQAKQKNSFSTVPVRGKPSGVDLRL